VGARLGAKARGRYSRRGPGDDRVSILRGEEEEAAEEAAEAGGSAGAPWAPEEEEGGGSRKVRFALLPGSYEPLRPPRAAGKRPSGKRLKKYGKVRAARCGPGGAARAAGPSRRLFGESLGSTTPPPSPCEAVLSPGRGSARRLGPGSSRSRWEGRARAGVSGARTCPVGVKAARSPRCDGFCAAALRLPLGLTVLTPFPKTSRPSACLSPPFLKRAK